MGDIGVLGCKIKIPRQNISFHTDHLRWLIYQISSFLEKMDYFDSKNEKPLNISINYKLRIKMFPSLMIKFKSKIEK